MYCVQIVVLFLLYNYVACVWTKNSKCYTKRCSAVKEGVQQLLDKRDENWSWGERVQAEAIIALHLAKFDIFPKSDVKVYISVKEMNIDLLSALSHDNDLSGVDWSRGKLAYYVLGLLATCQKPNDFYGHDLVTILKNNLVQQSSYLNSNKFAYALIVIALCKSGENVSDSVLNNISTTEGQYTFGVDEAAMVYLAYRCTNNSSFIDKENAAIQFILASQDPHGTFGNEYSTALALQVIFAGGNASLLDRTNKSINFLAKSIDKMNNPFTSLLLSVLPPLAKKSLLDVGNVQCPPEPTPTVPSGPVISTQIRVTNVVTASNFDQSWIASLTLGQTLYDAMVNLALASQGFSFNSKTTTWGQFITSINGMVASSDERQYWSILDLEGTPLSKGVSETFPTFGDSYQFNMTTW